MSWECLLPGSVVWAEQPGARGVIKLVWLTKLAGTRGQGRGKGVARMAVIIYCSLKVISESLW